MIGWIEIAGRIIIVTGIVGAFEMLALPYRQVAEVGIGAVCIGAAAADCGRG